MKRLSLLVLLIASSGWGASRRSAPTAPSTPSTAKAIPAMPAAAAATAKASAAARPQAAAMGTATALGAAVQGAAGPQALQSQAGSLNTAFDGNGNGNGNALVAPEPIAVAAASRPPLRLIITGPPASGKDEASSRLVRDFGIIHLSPGKILREYAKSRPELEAIMNKGELVPAELVIGIMKERMAQPDVREKGFVLDGFPRRLVEAKALMGAVKSGELAFDAMIVLDVPEEELLRRVLERRRGPDDTEEVFRNRMEVFRRETAPTIEYLSTQMATLRPQVGFADVEASYANVRGALDAHLAKRDEMDARFEKLVGALRKYMKRRGYGGALRALDFALEKHAGRRRDGLMPEAQHQVEIALFLTTLKGLPDEELTLATALLHDVVEDKGVSVREIRARFGRRIARRVSLLSKEEGGVKKELAAYFAAIGRDAVASIVKGADRIHNLQGMTGVFSPEKREEYIVEAETIFLPMLKEAERRHPRHGAAYRNIRHMLKSQIALLRAVSAGPR